MAWRQTFTHRIKHFEPKTRLSQIAKSWMSTWRRVPFSSSGKKELVFRFSGSQIKRIWIPKLRLLIQLNYIFARPRQNAFTLSCAKKSPFCNGTFPSQHIKIPFWNEKVHHKCQTMSSGFSNCEYRKINGHYKAYICIIVLCCGCSITSQLCTHLTVPKREELRAKFKQ